ncbi:polysaccharide deacetylase family protein [Oceaniferula spumae]|uniref:polysaccharide deacetylase family protein n=1 Tax=Oceaniferula spumae TaxID=2979115 RepID=UPI003F4EB528
MRLALMVVLYLAGIGLMLSGHFWLGTGLHVLLVTPILWGTLNPNSSLFGALQRTVPSNKIWLTLDDGPDPVDTPAVLELLRERGVKATFFVIGEKADQHPDLIRQIVAEGHQLANHTHSHPQGTFWCLGPVRTFREISRCQSSIKTITGNAPTIFRAPVGHHNIFVHPVLRRFGMRLVGWTSRGLDGVSTDLEDIVERLHKTMAPGTIVLAHESTPVAREVVEAILDRASDKGWKFIDPLQPTEAGE